MDSEIDQDPLFRQLKMLPQLPGSARQELMRVRLREAFLAQHAQSARSRYFPVRKGALAVVAVLLVALAVALWLGGAS